MTSQQAPEMVGRLSVYPPAPLETTLELFVREKLPQLGSSAQNSQGLASLLIDAYDYELQQIPRFSSTRETVKKRTSLIAEAVERLLEAGKLVNDPRYGIVLAEELL